MNRPVIYSIIVSALIVLANWWLSHVLSNWSISSAGEKQGVIWASITAGLAALLQFPALIVSKWVADGLALSTTWWATVTSAVSIMIYSPLVYVLSDRRRKRTS